MKKIYLKKVFLLITALSFIFTSSYSFAAMNKLPKHTFGIGPEVYHVRYWETSASSDIMSESGVMAGFVTQYSYHGDNKLMLRPELRFDWGSVDYKSPDNLTGVNNIPDFLFETRILIGYDYYVETTPTVLTLYTGFGYRYLNDDGKGKVASDGGYLYERDSSYYYSPIGIEGLTDMGNGWFIGATAELDLLWRGVQKSHISQVPGYDNDPVSNQNSGLGFRFSLKALKKSKILDFSVEPFYRRWRIKKGTADSLVYDGTPTFVAWEPKNDTEEIGVNLSVAY